MEPATCGLFHAGTGPASYTSTGASRRSFDVSAGVPASQMSASSSLIGTTLRMSWQSGVRCLTRSNCLGHRDMDLTVAKQILSNGN